MFKKLMSKLNPTVENLQEELLSKDFNEDNAEAILSSNKIDINHKNDEGETLLLVCLNNDRYKASVWLIEHGIDTTISVKGSTAIRIAVNKGATKVVKSFIKNQKLNIDQVDDKGRSLLQDAIIMGHRAVVQVLIENGISPNTIDSHGKNAIFDAIDYGDEKIIDMLLEIEDINLSAIDHSGKTILHDKKVLEDDDLARKLLEKGADPTINDKNKNNFLTHIVLKGEAGEELLDIAIANGCNLDTKVADENSILMEVMQAFSKIPKEDKERRGGMEKIAKKLLDSGIDIDAINNKGETALFNLARINDLDGCAFLLNHGVQPNIINNVGETVLSIVILKGFGYIDLISLLLDYKASPLIKNEHGKTLCEQLNDIILHVHDKCPMEDQELLEKIHSKGNYMLVLKEILSRKDINFNYWDSTGQPLFFMPFLKGYNDLCQLYLKAGLNINMRNKHSHTLFFEYNVRVFEQNEYFEEYRSQLIYLILHKANVSTPNKEGQTIYTKIALLKHCNLQLFRKLNEVARYDFTKVDKLGRTILHSCVWGGNLELLKLIYSMEESILNVPDKLNILPITYAALFGNKEIVLELLKKDALVTTEKDIPDSVKKRFKPLLKNLKVLVVDVEDKDILNKLKILLSQVVRDLT
jgi:ankyrin repeat protein